ncbi:arylsulfatase [Phycisphaeraceae bacterium D3-23]
MPNTTPHLLAILLLIAGVVSVAPRANAQPNDPPPNIVLILTDDLGYGDVSCYNDQARVQTPHIDRLAQQGILLTDAHSPSTVCTPTRYSVLTGRMAYRLDFRGVFSGAGGPCLIRDEALTLPELLRTQGYTTACIGKWHIGLSFYDDAGEPIHENGRDAAERIDFSRRIDGGPIDHGFDHFFGTACCPTTDWLYAWIVDDRIPNPPTQYIDRRWVPDHPYSQDCRPGRIADDFDLEEVDLVFLEKSQTFIREHVAEQPDTPFFLFHNTQGVHLPSLAAERFQGATDAGPHGDFIHELDWVVGELMQTLDELGVADNTIVIFTSDNGPEVPTVIHMRADHNHDGARPWRGMKRDNWEGGHRVPTIVRWPGQITPGTTTGETMCLTDLMATCAAIVGAELPEDAAGDSFDMLPALLGEARDAPIRPYTTHQTISLALAIRRGDWKYLDHTGSGGNRYRGELEQYILPDNAPDAPAQLYNLADDPGETTNLYHEHPEIAAELKALLDHDRATGRSRP